MSTSKLRTLTNKILNKDLRRKVKELLENPTFELDGKTYRALPLETAPAGLSHHHNYPGGYIEHVTSTMNIALALCDSAEKIYHGEMDRDLVIAGVLLHDFYKTTTYAKNKDGGYTPTALAQYLDHMSLATAELVRRNFPLELVHIVAAHHGQYGPIRPRTLEALICHLADFTDSRLNGEVLDAAQYLTRKATGQGICELTSKEAFEIVHSKSTNGWKGLNKTVSRIKQKRRTHKT